MSKKPLNISEEAAVQMPMKTVASLISICVIGAWFAFSVIERLNVLETKNQLVEKDLAEDTIVVMKDWCANKTSLINDLEANKATIPHYYVKKDKEGNVTDINMTKYDYSYQLAIYDSVTFSNHVKSYNEHGSYWNATQDAESIYKGLHRSCIIWTKRDVAKANAHIVQLQKMIEEIHGKPLIAAA